MKLTKVSITGADDKTDPKKLAELSLKYPFVEWAILLSRSEGRQRFPSLPWIENFLSYKLNSAGHLCGAWVRELMDHGNYSFKKERPQLFDKFFRIQINLHGEEYLRNSKFIDVLDAAHEYIYQIDGVNDDLLYESIRYDIEGVPLFDKSHGVGISPDHWPDPIIHWNGYAGGINPDNIVKNIESIQSKPHDSLFWIDMETGVRTNNEFDLGKVERCLELSARFVES